MKKIICDYCNKESDNTTEDVCPNCAKKIIGLLQLVPRVNFEEENNIETMSIKW